MPMCFQGWSGGAIGCSFFVVEEATQKSFGKRDKFLPQGKYIVEECIPDVYFYFKFTLNLGYTVKETQSNLSQVSIVCIDKVIQNALIFYAR